MTSSSRSVYAFFGPPGSGKGTQSEKLLQYCKDKNITIVTMGAGIALRNLVSTYKNSVVAELVEKSMLQGVSVPGAIVTSLWVEPLLTVSPEDSFAYFVDGPCRVQHETELFVDFISTLNAQLYVIELVLDDNECLNRMLARAKQKQEVRADDASITTMKTRLQVYRDGSTDAMHNLVGYMKEKTPTTSHHIQLDASKTIEEIFEALKSRLNI